MVEIGKYNQLRVVKEVEFGVYLDGGDFGEILMPSRYVPEGCQPDDMVEVFIYFDSDDRIIATTEKPLATVGEIASLKVVAKTNFGAFLDWGLMKDILVPFREQKERMAEGENYVVYIYEDSVSNRIVATSKVDKYIDNEPAQYEEGEEVDILVYDETDLGFKAVVNGKHSGILYYNEVFQDIHPGDALKAYIKKLREDGKIDLTLQKTGFEQIDDFSQVLLDDLKASEGFVPLNDKSDPDAISTRYGVSKKNFKKAVGTLYKKKLITLHADGIRSVK